MLALSNALAALTEASKNILNQKLIRTKKRNLFATKVVKGENSVRFFCLK
jgi:hypothetical protein